MRKQITVIIVTVAILITAVALYAGGRVRTAPQRPIQPPQPQKTKPPVEAIEGRVLNAEGQPVAGAKVFAESEGALTGISPSSRTDDNGNYRIEVGQPGTYKVFGSKEEDGYPLTISGFHQEGTNHIPTVSVLREQVVLDIVVQLGAKAASIEGLITDVITNRTIDKAVITLRRADNPEIYYMIGADEEKKEGRFSSLVPSVPITIEVSAPGYEAWAYSKDGLNKHSDSLKVNRGETKKLTVSLHRKNNPKT